MNPGRTVVLAEGAQEVGRGVAHVGLPEQEGNQHGSECLLCFLQGARTRVLAKGAQNVGRGVAHIGLPEAPDEGRVKVSCLIIARRRAAGWVGRRVRQHVEQASRG